MEAEDNSDEQEPRPPPSLPDSFPTSDDEINDSLWSLLTDTNFDISTIGEEQEPEPEPPTHPPLQESDVEEDLLRRKRRRLESFPAEISRDEYWEFLGRAKNSKLTLDQGRYLMEWKED